MARAWRTSQPTEWSLVNTNVSTQLRFATSLNSASRVNLRVWSSIIDNTRHGPSKSSSISRTRRSNWVARVTKSLSSVSLVKYSAKAFVLPVNVYGMNQMITMRLTPTLMPLSSAQVSFSVSTTSETSESTHIIINQSIYSKLTRALHSIINSLTSGMKIVKRSIFVPLSLV